MLLIRADASAKIGTGHIMRCLALAQAWQDHGPRNDRIALVAALLSPALEQRVRAEGIEIFALVCEPGSEKDSAETAALARTHRAHFVAIDGYAFGDAYQSAMKAAGHTVLFIDDFGHALHYSADLVLNQNVYATTELYARRERDSRLLLGCDFVLLRREFLRHRSQARDIPARARRILVSLGGADPDHVTIRMAEGLSQIRAADLEVRILVGASCPYRDQLEKIVRGAIWMGAVISLVSDFVEQLRWADIVLEAGGTTALEVAFMGLPALGVSLVDHQLLPLESLAAKGVLCNLGPQQRITPELVAQEVVRMADDVHQRKEMSVNGRHVVDGGGPERVVSAMLAVPAGGS